MRVSAEDREERRAHHVRSKSAILRFSALATRSTAARRSYASAFQVQPTRSVHKLNIIPPRSISACSASELKPIGVIYGAPISRQAFLVQNSSKMRHIFSRELNSLQSLQAPQEVRVQRSSCLPSMRMVRFCYLLVCIA